MKHFFRRNAGALYFQSLIVLTGYCLGGQIGVGVALSIILCIQMIAAA